MSVHLRHLTTKNLWGKEFKQGVKMATHIEGGHLDHVYINSHEKSKLAWVVEIFPKYYSDHDGIGLTLWKEADQMETIKSKQNWKSWVVNRST